MILSIGDLRDLARKRIPRAIFDYAAGGSYEERTLSRNARTSMRSLFRQRVMVDVSNVRSRPRWSAPRPRCRWPSAPTGLAGSFSRGRGDFGARAAAACGIPYCMSTMSICSIEDVREATGQPFWFQQYLMKDRGFNQELIDRAARRAMFRAHAHAGSAGAGGAAPGSAQRPHHPAAPHRCAMPSM